MSLEDLTDKQARYRASFLAGLSGAVVGILGESAQALSNSNNFITNHLSDLAGVFAASSLSYYLTPNKKYGLALSMVPPVLCTIHEYFPFTSENVMDNMDTVMYWSGWAASSLALRFFGRSPKFL